MSLPNWKNGSSWEAITAAALAGTYGGTLYLAQPQATEVNGLGQPCGAFGLPEIRLSTPWMTGTGMAFWQARLGGALYAALAMEVLNPVTAATEKYLGQLEAPTWQSISWGATAAKTIYRGVQIRITNCETTS